VVAKPPIRVAGKAQRDEKAAPIQLWVSILKKVWLTFGDKIRRGMPRERRRTLRE
jgi:hypothetical protein